MESVSNLKLTPLVRGRCLTSLRSVDTPDTSITSLRGSKKELSVVKSDNYVKVFQGASDIVDDIFSDENSKEKDLENLLKIFPLSDSEKELCLKELSKNGYGTDLFCKVCGLDSLVDPRLGIPEIVLPSETKVLQDRPSLKINLDQLPDVERMDGYKGDRTWESLEDIEPEVLRLMRVSDLIQVIPKANLKIKTVSTPTTPSKRLATYRSRGVLRTLPSMKLGEGEGGEVFSTCQGTAVKVLDMKNNHGFMDLKGLLLLKDDHVTPEVKGVTIVDNKYHLEMELFQCNLAEYISKNEISHEIRNSGNF